MNRRGFFGALVGGIAAATGVRACAGSRVTFFKSATVGKTDMLLSAFGPDLRVLPDPNAGLISPAELHLWERECWSRPPVAPHLVQAHPGDLDPLQEALPEDGILGEIPVVHDVDLVLSRVDDLGRHAEPVEHHAHNHLQRQDLTAEEGPLFDRIAAHRPLPTSPAYINAEAAVVSLGADLPEVWPGPSGAITATAALPPLDQVETLVELFGASGDAAPSFAAALIGELVLTRMRFADLRRLHMPAGLA